jgi:anti-sigma factor RsiW
MENGAAKPVSHFDAPACADFARNLLDAKDRAEVEGHLPTCPKCAATARWLRTVSAVAAADEQYEPPAQALEHARALFAIERVRAIVAPPSRAGATPNVPAVVRAIAART